MTFSKLVGKSKFLRKKLKKCTSLVEHKGTRYIRETFILANFGLFFCLQNSASDFFQIVLFET